MGKSVLRWNLASLTRTIVATLLNKYDFFCVIEGGTGTGKSTLAFHIASKVSKEFHRLYMLRLETLEYYYERVGRKMGLTEEEWIAKILKLKEGKKYKFVPQVSLIYTQDDLQQFLAGWQGISIPDELINCVFNRDFQSEKQKNIIKELNMLRDHENLSLSCVPAFQVIDNQIKNLTKMKITVKRRGVAIIHTPNSVVYCKDRWDQATNEKIERDWIMKKIRNPNYSKLTTFRGLIRFPPLSKKQEAMYQQIKNDKRSIVLKDDMNIDSEEKKEDDPFTKLYKRLVKGSVKNSDEIIGFGDAIGLSATVIKHRLAKRLIKEGKPRLISNYLYGKTKKEKTDDKQFDSL